MDIHKYPLILIPTPSRGGKIADIFGYLNIHLVIYPLQKFHFLLNYVTLQKLLPFLDLG